MIMVMASPRIQLASANLQHLFVEALFGSWEIAVLCWTCASCLSLVFVWSFPLVSRPLPLGYSRNSWHKGRQSRDNTKERCGYWTGVLPAAFRILSPIWVFPQNSRPIPWLMIPRLTASPSCKELSIPERAVDKKNSTQRRRKIKKNVWPLTGGRFLSQQVLLKPQPTEYKKAE